MIDGQAARLPRVALLSLKIAAATLSRWVAHEPLGCKPGPQPATVSPRGAAGRVGRGVRKVTSRSCSSLARPLPSEVRTSAELAYHSWRLAQQSGIWRDQALGSRGGRPEILLSCIVKTCRGSQPLFAPVLRPGHFTGSDTGIAIRRVGLHGVSGESKIAARRIMTAVPMRAGVPGTLDSGSPPRETSAAS